MGRQLHWLTPAVTFTILETKDALINKCYAVQKRPSADFGGFKIVDTQRAEGINGGGGDWADDSVMN